MLDERHEGQYDRADWAWAWRSAMAFAERRSRAAIVRHEAIALRADVAAWGTDMQVGNAITMCLLTRAGVPGMQGLPVARIILDWKVSPRGLHVGLKVAVLHALECLAASQVLPRSRLRELWTVERAERSGALVLLRQGRPINTTATGNVEVFGWEHAQVLDAMRAPDWRERHKVAQRERERMPDGKFT